ncbi:hypothetical protein AgCh_021453 [Apium graveolens]
MRLFYESDRVKLILQKERVGMILTMMKMRSLETMHSWPWRKGSHPHQKQSMVEATEEVSRLSKANEKLEIEKQDLELQLVELETVKQENEYLKNKLKCAAGIEAVLREKLEKNKVKLKSFRNPSQLVGQYHEKNKPCANIAIGLDYDALNNNMKFEGDKGKATVSEDVSAMLRKVETTLTSKPEKKPMVDQTPKKLIKEEEFIRNKPREVLGIGCGKLGAERSKNQEQNSEFSRRCLGARSGCSGGRSGAWAPAQESEVAAQGREN